MATRQVLANPLFQVFASQAGRRKDLGDRDAAYRILVLGTVDPSHAKRQSHRLIEIKARVAELFRRDVLDGSLFFGNQ